MTLIDNNAARLAAIAKDGLSLVDDAGERLVRPATSVADQFKGPVDLLILFTKGMHSAAAVGSVAHLAALRPVALTLQNGLGNAEILAATFSADLVLMGTAHLPADLEAPNRVITHGFAHVHLGGFVPASQPLAKPAGQALLKGGFKVEVATDAQAAVWEKLAFNAALNAMAMITGATNGEMNTEGGQRIARAVVDETVAVARAAGIKLHPQQIKETVAMAFAQHPHHKASMLQDREAGRPSEIESINGAIARVADDHGVAAPVNATLADLVRIIEARARAK